jgi:hypothetical protein
VRESNNLQTANGLRNELRNFFTIPAAPKNFDGSVPKDSLSPSRIRSYTAEGKSNVRHRTLRGVTKAVGVAYAVQKGHVSSTTRWEYR